MELNDMGKWPGSPGAGRLFRAREIIEGRGQAWQGGGEEAQRDARMLLRAMEAMEFTQLGTARVLELQRAEQVNRSRDLVAVAMEGTSEDFVGMIIQPEGDGDGPIPFIITKLQRDPEWVGVNPSLEFCRGLEVHIFVTQDDPGAVAMVAAAPDWEQGTGTTWENPGEDLEATIRDVVMWHGATLCVRIGTDRTGREEE